MSPTDPPATPRRALTAKLLLALSVGWLAAELGLRVVDALQGRPAWGALEATEPTSSRYEPHPYMGYVARPGPIHDVNAQGHRGPAVARRKPEDVFRVVCLGGSTTFCGLLDEADSWPRVLEGLLNEGSAGPRFEVLNAAVPGYSSAESLINLALRMVEFEPDAVLVYHGINDARLIQVGGFLPDYAHKRSSWRHPAVSPVETLLLRWSRVFLRAFGSHYVNPGALRLDHLLFHPGPHPEPAWGDGVNQAGVATFLRNVVHIATLAREHGATTVLTTFARCPARLPGGGHEAVLDAMNRGLTRLARERDLPLVQLDGPISGRDALFRDYVHFTVPGARAMARQIFAQLRDAGVWPLR